MIVCPPPPSDLLPLTAVLAVGFGYVAVTRDGLVVWEGDDERVKLRRFERMAKADPDHDWQVTFMGPLSDATYKRNADGQWVLVERGRGFA